MFSGVAYRYTKLAFDVRMRCGPKTISIAHVYTPSRSVTGCFGVRSSHSNTSWNSLLLRKGVRDFQPLAIPQQQKEKGYANDRHVSDEFDKRGFVVALGNEDNVRYRHHDGQGQNREANRRAKDQYDPDDGFDHAPRTEQTGDRRRRRSRGLA